MAHLMSVSGASVSRTECPLVSARRKRSSSLGWATATCSPSASRWTGMTRCSRATSSGTRASASGNGVLRRRSVTGRPKKSANASTRPRSSRAPMSTSTSPSRFPEPACCWSALATWASVTRPRVTSTSPRSPRGRAGFAASFRATAGTSCTGVVRRGRAGLGELLVLASSMTRTSPSGTAVLLSLRRIFMVVSPRWKRWLSQPYRPLLSPSLASAGIGHDLSSRQPLRRRVARTAR